ncbi:hypothetical protein GCM10018787_49540 [Streptomyces thermodiastaticus]|nr:hypothetical protein GCM10018787_49540 [Streptomyces thermodiastaticus]
MTDKHWLIDKGVKILAATGTGLCITLAPCGVGLFIVGAGALFAGGLVAHYALSSPEERRQGVSTFLVCTAKAEGMGIVAGSLCGRGIGGCVALRPKAGLPLEGVPRASLGKAALGVYDEL